MESFSAAASAIAADHQVIDIVASLLLDCAALLPASSTALMVRRDDDRLVLLHSTSHRVAEIEMLQIQSDRGPCVDAISGGVELSETGTRAIVARWGRRRGGHCPRRICARVGVPASLARQRARRSQRVPGRRAVDGSR
jgi:hypothetical protein